MCSYLLVIGFLGILGSVDAAPKKITIFSNEQAMLHVIHSSELRALRKTGAPLFGLDITDIKIRQPGGHGTGATYEVSFVFSRPSWFSTTELPAQCEVTATVKNEKMPGPPRLVGNHLGRPTFSVPNCVN